MQTRIVVVDDVQDVLDLCSFVVRGMGFEAVAFGEPVEAIDYLSRGTHADLVLIDLALPQMSGLDLARLIAKARPTLPVVLMTGHPSHLEEAIAGGMLPLVKPFTAHQLEAAIRDALSCKLVQQGARAQGTKGDVR